MTRPDGLGPHHAERTPSRPIWEVKQRRARLVLAWVTGWEYHVFKPLKLFKFFSCIFKHILNVLQRVDFISKQKNTLPKQGQKN